MNIGRLARWYRWIEYAAYGRALERSRFAFLPLLAGVRQVLILGEGDGRTLASLQAIAPRAQFDVFESSPEMIELAKARITDCSRVVFHCEDARKAAWPAAGYDAIVTHFFLDCFNSREAGDLVARLAATLKPDGLWLISEFAIPATGWRRMHARIWITTMYHFFRLTTGLQTRKLPPIDDLLRRHAMQRTEQLQQRAGVITSEVWRHKSRVAT